MSAWLCGNGTLSLCVDVLKTMEKYSDKDSMELLEELSDLNTKSLNCRYGKDEWHILRNKEYISMNVDDGQRYKSVRCYLYQTCECKENYKHPLFMALSDWTDDNEKLYEDGWSKYQWDIDNPI